MKKIYINGVHEYDHKLVMNHRNEIHQLYYSQHHEWSESFRGKLAMDIIDTGNAIHIPKPMHNIDYSEAQQLRILLGIIMKDDCEELQIREDI